MATEGSNLNPGQLRKIRIIEKTFGPGWQNQYAGMAIDAVYNLAIQDDRKSVFCKIDKHRKDKLTEMLDAYGTTMGEFIGTMIDSYYQSYLERKGKIVEELAEDFSGT
jgi:hypothetical protein